MKATLTISMIALGLALPAAFAAPIGVRAPGTAPPATRSLAPAAPPGSAAIPTPSALRPDLVVQNNVVSLGGRPIGFGGSAGIVSTAIAQPSGAQRGRERVPSCSFNGAFTIRNAGGGPAPAVDIKTYFEQPQGPQVGEISSMVYGNPALKPGGTQTWSFGATLMQGSYVFHLVIDPKHLDKQYALNLKLSCGYGGIPQMHAPSALTPAPGGFAPGPSGGIKLARSKTNGIFMRVEGINGESKDPAHPGWIELESVSWQGEGTAGEPQAAARNGCRQTSLVATKRLDKSSSQLLSLTQLGKPTTITIDAPVGRRTLQNALITSVSSSGGGDRPLQTLSAAGTYCP